MSALDWIIVAGIAVLLVLAVIYTVRQVKKGRCIGCSGGCASCPHNCDKKKDNK